MYKGIYLGSQRVFLMVRYGEQDNQDRHAFQSNNNLLFDNPTIDSNLN